MTDHLTTAYERSHPGSAALNQRARSYFPGHGATHFVRIRSPFRPYIVRAAGSRKWDVDGNQYIDYVLGHGALILGHGHPAVVDAVRRQAELGFHYGDNHHLEVEWAERIRGLMPGAERIEYFASGQEANLMALRVARSTTGRKKILKFKHSYHGWVDELAAEGAPGTITDHLTVIPADDRALLEEHLAGRAYAAVLMEGGGAKLAGRIPVTPEFFRAVPDLARKYGTATILDEIVTGFREAPGGWQSVVGMTPDLTTVGKAVGGGLPCGVLLGRSDLLAALSPDSGPERLVVHGGTWNAVPLTCAAGIAACIEYQGGAPQRIARERADQLRTRANALFEKHDFNARLFGRSILHVYLGAFDLDPVDDTAPPTSDINRLVDPAMTPLYKRLDLHLLSRGISSTRGEALNLSSAHTEEDVELTATALVESLLAMREEGTIT